MHSLFKEQLRETTRPDGSVDLDKLSELVSCAYDERDSEWQRTQWSDIAELKQREQSGHRLFESSPLPLWIWDRETLRFLAVNDAALAMYGYSREQFLTMTLFDIRGPKEHEALATVLQGHLEPTSALTFRHRKSDGSEIDVDVYAQEQTYAGRPAVFSVIIDVTARRHTERELLRTREFLNTIVENIPLGVFVKDAKTLRYILVNRASEEYSGLSRNKLIGKAPHDIYPAEIATVVVSQDRLVIDKPPVAAGRAAFNGRPAKRQEAPAQHAEAASRRFLRRAGIPDRRRRGHHRASCRAGRDRAPRPPRYPDRLGQSRRVQQRARPTDAKCARWKPHSGGAQPRHRPFQGRERRLRASGRR